VLKTSGTTSDRMSRRKIVANGCNETPTLGDTHPTVAPTIMAITIHCVREGRRILGARRGTMRPAADASDCNARYSSMSIDTVLK
jgi:hypothetical protein